MRLLPQLNAAHPNSGLNKAPSLGAATAALCRPHLCWWPGCARHSEGDLDLMEVLQMVWPVSKLAYAA